MRSAITSLRSATRAGADEAYAQHIQYSTRDPRLMEAAAALCENRIAGRRGAAARASEAASDRRAGDAHARGGRGATAVAMRMRRVLLERCLELAPSFAPARHNYAVVLHRQRKTGSRRWRRSISCSTRDPRNPGYRNLKAAHPEHASASTMQRSQLYAGVLAEYPHNAKVWMSYGHALKTAGRQDECVRRLPQEHRARAASRRGVLEPREPEDVQVPAGGHRGDAARSSRAATLTPEDRFHFHFALGKALEDAGGYAASFEHYAEGNRLRREVVGYDAEENTRARAALEGAVHAGVLRRARRAAAASAPDPDLHRRPAALRARRCSNRSWPAIRWSRARMELPDMVAIARGAGRHGDVAGRARYPEALAALDADALRALGERYLQQTRIQRKTRCAVLHRQDAEQLGAHRA